jgi:hypothetical protein
VLLQEMREILSVPTLIAVMCCVSCVGATQAQGLLQPNQGEAVFPGEGSVIILSQGEILFNVDGAPGFYEAQSPVEVLVGADAGSWVLSCEAQPLVCGRGEIPPERILVRSINGGSGTDQRAREAYRGLEEPRVVAEGPYLGPVPVKVSTLMFAVLTTCEDKPGTYVGSVTLTYLFRP